MRGGGTGKDSKWDSSGQKEPKHSTKLRCLSQVARVNTVPNTDPFWEGRRANHLADVDLKTLQRGQNQRVRIVERLPPRVLFSHRRLWPCAQALPDADNMFLLLAVIAPCL